MYCVKCKNHTENGDEMEIVTTKNNRFRKVSTCKECGSKKSAFIKMEHEYKDGND